MIVHGLQLRALYPLWPFRVGLSPRLYLCAIERFLG